MAEKIEEMINKFVSEKDISIMFANMIGVKIDDKFPDDDYLEFTVEMLARYRPEGGDFLYDTDDIKKRLMETKDYLRRLMN